MLRYTIACIVFVALNTAIPTLLERLCRLERISRMRRLAGRKIFDRLGYATLTAAFWHLSCAACLIKASILSTLVIWLINFRCASMLYDRLFRRSYAASAGVLVIVDMQPHFPAARDESTINGCLMQIGLWRERGWPIVVLEYEGCGPTDARIDAALAGYDNFRRLTKPRDDGSAEVLKGCRSLDFAPDLFRICGVNINACVQSTVRGLMEKSPAVRLEIVTDACNDGGSGRVFIGYPRSPLLHIASSSQLGMVASA